VSLPEVEGRTWRLLVDTSKAAPFDVLTADDRLSEDDMAMATATADMTTRQGVYLMLPWSSVVMESVEEVGKVGVPPKFKKAHAW